MVDASQRPRPSLSARLASSRRLLLDWHTMDRLRDLLFALSGCLCPRGQLSLHSAAPHPLACRSAPSGPAHLACAPRCDAQAQRPLIQSHQAARRGRLLLRAHSLLPAPPPRARRSSSPLSCTGVPRTGHRVGQAICAQEDPLSARVRLCPRRAQGGRRCVRAPPESLRTAVSASSKYDSAHSALGSGAAYKRFRHPNIIRCLDSCVLQDPEEDCKVIYLFLPFYNNGT